MGLVIDSSVLIAWERGRLDAAAQINGRTGEEVYLSVISASELLHGVQRAVDAGTRARRAAFVESVLGAFALLAIDLDTARCHAVLWAELLRQGSMVGLHDSWIAASCLAHGHALATANLRDFVRIPGLRVEHWS